MNLTSSIRSAGEKIEQWTNRHYPKWLNYLRILLGVVILIKGITFILNKQQTIHMISGNEYWLLHNVIAHYIIGGYIVCGIAIIIGLFTRLVVLFEIPALSGSIIFVDFHKDLLAINSEAAYSIILLALLLFFLIYGPGKISIDYYIQTRKDKNFNMS
jgi:putative oxidoreductase